MKTLLSAAVVVSLAAPGLAQGNPRGEAAATLGGKKVTVDYGRPSLKGRSFDELLGQLEADRIWRCGSEQVTTITTEGDILIGGQRLAAGKYSLYVHAPKEGDFALAINKDLGVPLGKIWDQAPDRLKNEPWPQMKYEAVQEQEVARVKLTQTKAAAPADQFTIGFTPGAESVLSLTWGDRSWTVPVSAAK